MTARKPKEMYVFINEGNLYLGSDETVYEDLEEIKEYAENSLIDDDYENVIIYKLVPVLEGTKENVSWKKV